MKGISAKELAAAIDAANTGDWHPLLALIGDMRAQAMMAAIERLTAWLEEHNRPPISTEQKVSALYEIATGAATARFK